MGELPCGICAVGSIVVFCVFELCQHVTDEFVYVIRLFILHLFPLLLLADDSTIGDKCFREVERIFVSAVARVVVHFPAQCRKNITYIAFPICESRFIHKGISEIITISSSVGIGGDADADVSIREGEYVFPSAGNGKRFVPFPAGIDTSANKVPTLFQSVGFERLDEVGHEDGENLLDGCTAKDTCCTRKGGYTSVEAVGKEGGFTHTASCTDCKATRAEVVGEELGRVEEHLLDASLFKHGFVTVGVGEEDGVLAGDFFDVVLEGETLTHGDWINEK